MISAEELFLSDAHAHLESYAPDDLDELIMRGLAKGVRRIVANGITLRSSAKSVEIAAQYPFIWATVGLHPFYAERLLNMVGPLRQLAMQDRVVGIGEIGLDFTRHPETRELQLQLFDAQLRLARELDLPVVIHTSAAHRETLDAVQRSGIGEKQAIIQGFRGNPAVLDDWLRLGFYLSIGPTIVTKPTEALAEVIRLVPTERLLLETDTRVGRTLSEGLELAMLREIAEKVAKLRDVPFADIARVTTDNLNEVFKISEKP
jgi:TatD DNase family protein